MLNPFQVRVPLPPPVEVSQDLLVFPRPLPQDDAGGYQQALWTKRTWVTLTAIGASGDSLLGMSR